MLLCSLGGGEDYFSHKSGKYVDLHDNNATVFTANGSYSATLFANKYRPPHHMLLSCTPTEFRGGGLSCRTIDVIESHAAAGAASPLFIYLAFQSIHSPIQAPEEWVTPYAWIKQRGRRTMAGMATVRYDTHQPHSAPS